MLSRRSSYLVEGISIPENKTLISNSIVYSLARGKYESEETRMLKSILRSDDRFLELGGGLGYLSTLASKLVTKGAVCTIEANPELINYIKLVHKTNNVTVDVLNAAITNDSNGAAPFYLRSDFWSSSLSATPKAFIKRIEVPLLSLKEIVSSFKPTVIGVDIEGGEVDLFKFSIPDHVRVVFMELHPKVTGLDPIRDLEERLSGNGFTVNRQQEMLLAERTVEDNEV